MDTTKAAAAPSSAKATIVDAPKPTERVEGGAVKFAVQEKGVVHDVGDGGATTGTVDDAACAAAAAAVSSEDEAMAASSHGELAAFLSAARDYESTLPEDVARYYLREGGARADRDLVKLVALAADHFLAAIVNDAGEMAQLTAGAAAANPPARRCLRARDVARALQRAGVTTLRAEAAAAPPDDPAPALAAKPAAAPAARKKRGRGE